MVSTTDFFPPLVDDPADFGAIAAANACSDVFAMGGRVVMALNIAAFPGTAAGRRPSKPSSRPPRRPSPPPVGRWRAATPFAPTSPSSGSRSRAWSIPTGCGPSPGARPGDCLVLSKPLGSGIVLAGAEAGRQGRRHRDHAPAQPGGGRGSDRRSAPEVGPGTMGPHAVTDVTGYGLLGHGWEMAERSGVTLRFHASALPTVPWRAWRRPSGEPAPAATPATGPTSKAASPRPRRPRWKPSATTPRPQAACWPPSHLPTPRSWWPAAAGFVVVGEVVAGPAAVELGG